MKERLTGAIILVALIVLLVPELLTGPIRKKSAPAVSIVPSLEAPRAARTAPAEPPLRSYTLTLGGAQPAHAPVVTSGAQTPAQAAASSQQSPSESAPDSSAQTPPPATQTATPSHTDAPEVSRQGVGAESDGLQPAKSAAHMTVREARSSASSGSVTRSGWVVQLGSFASRQNAERLAHSLGARGFRMTVSPARAGSRVLWRVRAGPAHDRAGALRLATRLRALGHRGELLPVK